ncbi:DUF4184 family protein [Candidatus Micrarchaeota archaeon]|nr:DUF4184 family protein [Candidatus Micrarchaeota archaeon]
MPLTPFHLGYPLIAGLVARSWFSIPAAMMGSVILDLEPLFRILSGMETSHGQFHSFALAAVVGLVLGIIVWLLRKRLDSATKLFGVKQKTTAKSAFTGALFGTFSHVTLDILMHSPESGFRAFWPFSDATFFEQWAPFWMHAVSAVVLLVAVALYVIVVARENKQ